MKAVSFMAAQYTGALRLALMDSPQAGPRFAGGAAASLPIALAYFPVAVSFGVAGAKAGFTFAETACMSVVIYAGASQFLALALLAGGAAPLLAVVSLLAMNARHLLYAPALLNRVSAVASAGEHGAAPGRDGGEARRPLRWSWLWAHGLTDEVFASALGRLAATKGDGWSEAWQVGIGLGAYLAWVSGTVVGAVLGGGAFERWPAVDAALAFLMPALFLSLLLAMVQRRHWPVVVAAVGAFALGSALISPSSGILLGMVAGGLAGAFGALGGDT